MKLQFANVASYFSQLKVLKGNPYLSALVEMAKLTPIKCSVPGNAKAFAPFDTAAKTGGLPKAGSEMCEIEPISVEDIQAHWTSDAQRQQAEAPPKKARKLTKKALDALKAVEKKAEPSTKADVLAITRKRMKEASRKSKAQRAAKKKIAELGIEVHEEPAGEEPPPVDE